MATHQRRDFSELGEQAIALAEQLGRIAGTLEGTAEAWLNRRKLAEQLTRVRDGATQMLDGLTKASLKGRAAATAEKGRKKNTGGVQMAGSDPAKAPGKRHRKPTPSARGVKKSDQAIPKLRTAQAARQRRKSYA